LTRVKVKDRWRVPADDLGEMVKDAIGRIPDELCRKASHGFSLRKFQSLSENTLHTEGEAEGMFSLCGRPITECKVEFEARELDSGMLSTDEYPPAEIDVCVVEVLLPD